MMRVAAGVILSLTLFLFISCHSSSNDTSGAGKDSAAAPGAAGSKHNPEFRTAVKKEAVAEYREKAGNGLNDWYFSVRLYETARTDDYRVTMQYEELKGDDTIRLPDLGTPPRPLLQRGKDKYSCIIGFMDNDSVLREYKLVSVKDNGNALKITTLKHYQVTEGLKVVSR